MSLHCSITTLEGNVVASPTNWEGLEVSVPLNESRTAKVTISLFDDAAAQAIPLERMLKVYYQGRLVFWGVILKPVWDAAAGTIEINCIDPTIRLKHRYHRYGHAAVDEGYPIDGLGIRRIVESAIVTPVQLASGVPPLGILWGYDNSSHQGPKPADIESPQSGDGLWMIAQRGENIWDSLQSCSQAVVGPDFEFVPKDNLGSGQHVRMNTSDRIGQDRTGSVIFSYGTGSFNLENFTYEPDGDAVRNYFVTVNPGGEKNRADAKDKALCFSYPSANKYGYYQGWESTGTHDSHEVLVEKSRAWVAAYAYPPKFCTITPALNVSPQYNVNFWVGDTIRLQVARGHLNVDTTARVTAVTVSQQDAAGNSKANITCVPNITTPLSSEGS